MQGRLGQLYRRIKLTLSLFATFLLVDPAHLQYVATTERKKDSGPESLVATQGLSTIPLAGDTAIRLDPCQQLLACKQGVGSSLVSTP
jgi:hypothetical protein